MQTCISDLKTWMTRNKLKLNDDKTEAVLIKSNRTTFPNAQPTSLRVGSADSPFTTCARNLGFMISDMPLDKHISNVCRSAYVEIRQISSICQYLTVEVTKTLVCAFVLSKLDYCNFLLSGCPLHILRRLQEVQSSAAKLVFKSRRRNHVQSFLQALHWLPVQARVDYKLSTICHNFFSDSPSLPTFLTFSLCTHLPDNVVLLQTHGHFAPPIPPC